VQFIWPLRVPFLVIDPDPKYQWPVIGYPSRRLAGVLIRKPKLNDFAYRGILKRLEAQGYNAGPLKRAPQREQSTTGTSEMRKQHQTETARGPSTNRIRLLTSVLIE
jgi:hypothetical protein